MFSVSFNDGIQWKYVWIKCLIFKVKKNKKSNSQQCVLCAANEFSRPYCAYDEFSLNNSCGLNVFMVNGTASIELYFRNLISHE